MTHHEVRGILSPTIDYAPADPPCASVNTGPLSVAEIADSVVFCFVGWFVSHLSARWLHQSHQLASAFSAGAA